MITKENYEAYLLDKAEGNLSEQLLKELEFFLKANPQLQPEEDAYDEAFVMKYNSYEPLPYENELLKKPVIIPLVWKTVSIAASIALLIGVFFFLQPNNNTSSPIAKTQPLDSVSPKQNNISSKQNNSLVQENKVLISSNVIAKKTNAKEIQTNEDFNTIKEENIIAESENETVNNEITGVNLIAYEPNLIAYETKTENNNEIQVEKGLIEYEKQPIFTIPKPIRINISAKFENINIASNK